MISKTTRDFKVIVHDDNTVTCFDRNSLTMITNNAIHDLLIADIGIVGSCGIPKEVAYCRRSCYMAGAMDGIDMTLDTYKAFIDLHENTLLQISLGGAGEPTLHPDFPAMVDYATSKGIAVNTTTNPGAEHCAETIHALRKCVGVGISVSQQGSSVCPDVNTHVCKLIKAITCRNNHTKIVFHLSVSFPDPYNINRLQSLLTAVNVKKIYGLLFLANKDPLPSIGLIEYRSKKEYNWERWFWTVVGVAAAHNLSVGIDACLSHALNLAKEDTVVEYYHQVQHNLRQCDAGQFSTYVKPTGKLCSCSSFTGSAEYEHVDFNTVEHYPCQGTLGRDLTDVKVKLDAHTNQSPVIINHGPNTNSSSCTWFVVHLKKDILAWKDHLIATGTTAFNGLIYYSMSRIRRTNDSFLTGELDYYENSRTMKAISSEDVMETKQTVDMPVVKAVQGYRVSEFKRDIDIVYQEGDIPEYTGDVVVTDWE